MKWMWGGQITWRNTERGSSWYKENWNSVSKVTLTVTHNVSSRRGVA
jgi:hypothetical protein